MIRIAIDGPAAAGKSTVAKMVAESLDFIYIDTGAMYRALTLNVLEEGVNVNDEKSIVALLEKAHLELESDQVKQRVFLNHIDVTNAIRSSEVNQHVAQVAQLKQVRDIMVKKQQNLANNKSVVMDGRDIGTHVIPNAEVKIFLVASAEERAKRRHEENIRKGFPSDLNQIIEEIKQRDNQDYQRKISPLVKAHDAVEIDTTLLSINEVAECILAEVKKN